MTFRGRLVSALWIPVAAIAALAFVPPETALLSSYAIRWYAVALVLAAVMGRTRRWAAISAAGLSMAGGLAVALKFAGLLLTRSDFMFTTLVVGGLVVAILGGLQLVRLLRADKPGDPVVIAAVQIGIGLVANWAYFAPALFRLDPRNYPTETWATPFRNELPVLALALAAVGLGVSRSWRPALERLGVTLPAWWQPFLAVLVASLFLIAEPIANHLTFLLTPRLYFAIAAISNFTFGNADLRVEMLFAVMAGVCEETLFRGALQPRAGIVVTALLFAMIHTQYFATPIVAVIFGHGLIYGLLRSRINTTTAIMAHASYDLIGYFSMGKVGYAVIALLMVAVLAVPAIKHRRAIWTSLGPPVRA
ncbi:MAG TPA: CPBP family intramembrane glutamic endopeptidase [Candidatus Acidoferrum sp.]|nr:CPBP family intramembrane glutamic endopeptidase [Candidatus Acidoferrum sp.]